MTEPKIEIQAYICPFCHNDHSGDYCKTSDVKQRVQGLQAKIGDIRNSKRVIASQRDNLARLISQMRAQWLGTWAEQKCLAALRGSRYCQDCLTDDSKHEYEDGVCKYCGRIY